MNVHITSTPDFDFNIAKEVVLILNETPGAMDFLIREPLNVNQYGTIHPKMKTIDKIDFLHFNELFDLCQTFRTFREIPEDEYVVLITSIKNHKDWFSAFRGKNIFIHGEEWEQYTKKDAKYGISYQVIENIFQSQIDLGIIDIKSEPNIHDPSIGCINDFCEEKSDIMLKLRTADICESCFSRAIERKLDPLVLDQVLRIIGNLREKFILSNRIDSLIRPEQVHIDPIRTVTIGKKHIALDPLNKVVFIFFLQNLEGVETKLIADYNEDLKRIYKEVRDNPDSEVIDRMLDPNNSTFRTVKTRLNQELYKQLGPKLAEYYILVRVEIKDSINKYKINLEKEYIRIEPPQRK